MEILEDYKNLVGKKMVFSHMAQFAEQITLATEDGCVLMATCDYNEMEDGPIVRVLRSPFVIQVLLDFTKYEMNIMKTTINM
ncbi:hypothetical protein LAV73_14005 [Lysinibacillus xylanilyticus]|uniref:hypothetical protein n=1 Tax=Lysinibacillus xylanilyticus TaxID=582475 RepID=UPI002B24F2AD|nr:hypothetical protein [Lysinibacillus xylanilyticus]MEB2281098.1 hypothetical protein [Lysinibacillus xylanilyticus]